eukprot:15334150-Ditylum_brightwellii.AAC.1
MELASFIPIKEKSDVGGGKYINRESISLFFNNKKTIVFDGVCIKSNIGGEKGGILVVNGFVQSRISKP